MNREVIIPVIYKICNFFLKVIAIYKIAVCRLYRVVYINCHPGISCSRFILRGLPIIDIRNGARLEIGHGALLNSTNRGYHLNMHGPVKLMADRPGAAISIGSGTRIHGSCIHAFSSIEIGSNCLIAANCQIMDGSGHELSFSDVTRRSSTQDNGRPIVIGDNVWLGTGVIVLPGVTIGQGSVVGAGSIVAKDIPPMCLAAGNPAKVIRDYASCSDACKTVKEDNDDANILAD
jgi:acetyltransferase-like isoleucine patch superfamily enzyme